jgi:hypothetical protein
LILVSKDSKSFELRENFSKNAEWLFDWLGRQWIAAQIPLHLPVNGLHSIEMKADAFDFFQLTQNLEGVKT